MSVVCRNGNIAFRTYRETGFSRVDEELKRKMENLVYRLRLLAQEEGRHFITKCWDVKFLSPLRTTQVYIEPLHQDFQSYLGQLEGVCSIEETHRFAVQIFAILEHLQKHRVIQGALEPLSFFLSADGQTLKLADLENAFDEEECLQGPKEELTPSARLYASPERMDRVSKLTCQTDVWSAALIVAKIFGYSFPSGKQEDISSAVLEWAKEKEVRWLEEVFAKTLIVDPMTRSRASQVFLAEVEPISPHFDFPDSFTEVLGEGTFGEVCLGRNKYNIEVACKISHEGRDSEEWKSIVREYRNLEFFKGHKNIIQCLGVKVFSHNTSRYEGKIGLALKPMSGNLYDYLDDIGTRSEVLSLKKIQGLASQLANALLAVHSKYMIHCDVKSANILIYQCEGGEILLQLADFGDAVFKPNALFRVWRSDATYVVTRSYRAPEISLLGQLGQALDVWGFGCVIVEMLTTSLYDSGKGT